MCMDDNDGQMIFGDLGGLKLPDICLTGEEKPQKNLTQETSDDRGSNPGPLRDRQACCCLAHSGGPHICCRNCSQFIVTQCWRHLLKLLLTFSHLREFWEEYVLLVLYNFSPVRTCHLQCFLSSLLKFSTCIHTYSKEFDFYFPVVFLSHCYNGYNPLYTLELQRIWL